MVEVATRSYADLVVDDPQEFRVHGSIYTDPQIFAEEMRRIFERYWVYVGHESEIPAPGDYKTVVVGTQPLIVSRHEDGQIYVLYNRCRHRGAVVCREERGHSNFFRCRYHNWVYANNGDLIGMAQASGYPDDLDRSKYGLVQVPRVSTYRGLIFVNLSPDGPSLEEHLAPVRKYIDYWFGRSPVEEIEVLLPPHRYEYPGNWKLQAENGFDGYHGPAGFGAPDDIEVFTEMQTGLRATGNPWNLLSRGQHRERIVDGEAIGHTTDEAPQRALYREWKRAMSA